MAEIKEAGRKGFVMKVGTASICVLLLGIATAAAYGQAPAGVFADTTNPSGAFDPQKLDLVWQVDNITGALTLKITFPTEPTGGRGPRLPFSLAYNSSSTVTLQQTGNTYVPIDMSNQGPIHNFVWTWGTTNQPTAPDGPWTTSGSYFTISQSSIPSQTANGEVQYYGCTLTGPYLYTDISGNSHDLNLQTVAPIGHPTDGVCSDSTVNTSATTDGSALLTAHGSVVYPDGTVDTNGNLEDTNGNMAGVATIENTPGLPTGNELVEAIGTLNFAAYDSLGRTPFTTTLPIGYPGTIPPGTYTVTTSGSSGESETYKIAVSTTPIGSYTMPHPTLTDGGTGSFTISQPTSGQLVPFISSITLPNLTTYLFTPDLTYGTISKITFPTGGYVRFVYGVRNNGGGYGFFTAISTVVVTDVYLWPGSGTEQHWAYTFSPTLTSSTVASTVVAPDGTSTQYTGIGGQPPTKTAFAFGQSPSWRETQRLVSNSAGTLVESVATAYSGFFPSNITTTSYDGGSGLQSQIQLQYDTYNNVTEKDESAFYTCTGSPCAVASTPPSGWLRKTFTTYQYQNQNYGAWVTAHIVNKSSQVLVTDGSGHPYSLVQYGYDKGTVGGVAGYANHDDTKYGLSSTLPRGNRTSESHCATIATTAVVTPSTAASACSLWLTTTFAFDLAGQVTSKTDPKGNVTSYSYTDNYAIGSPSKPTDGYITTVTYPYGFTDNYTYYYASGQVASHGDWNSQPTNYTYADPGKMHRLTEIHYPDSGEVQYGYNGDSAPPKVTTTTQTGGTEGAQVRNIQYDGLGRVAQQQVDINSTLTSYIDTTYDSMGRIFSVSNPYYSASDPTYGLTYYCYDAIGRKLLQVQPDNGSAVPVCGSTNTYTSAQHWSYLASNTIGFQDENGNQWQRTVDALGRLTKVLEPSGSSKTPTLETDYSYDVLGDLTAVSQCGAACPASSPVNRQFSYDGLSRLIQSYNPEAGWTCYGTSGGTLPNGSNCTSGYDSNSNLQFKTDARGVVTNYQYDALNRLLSKTFSNDGNKTPSSCFQYDSSSVTMGKGRLSSEWTQSASVGVCPASAPSTGLWSRRSFLIYDPMGRVRSEQQCTPSNCSSGAPYAPTYTYDLAGNLIGSTNGITSTPVVNTLSLTNLFDQAGRQQGLSSNWVDSTHPSSLYTAQTASTGPCPLSQTYAIAAFGGLLNASFGGGLTLNRSYDVRLRTTCETDTGSLLTNSTNASAEVTMTGQEQSK